MIFDQQKLIFQKVVDLLRDHRHSAQNFAAVVSSMVSEHLVFEAFSGGGGGSGPSCPHYQELLANYENYVFFNEQNVFLNLAPRAPLWKF